MALLRFLLYHTGLHNLGVSEIRQIKKNGAKLKLCLKFVKGKGIWPYHCRISIENFKWIFEVRQIERK